MFKTVEEIADEAECFQGRANIAAINRAFRAQDESHLWPVNNRFNATERAIHRIRRLDSPVCGYEYAALLDAEIGRIVNDAV